MPLPYTPHAVIELKRIRRTPDGKEILEDFGQFDSWREDGLFTGVDVELTTGAASQAEWKVFDPNFKFIDRFAREGGIPELQARVWLGLERDLGEPIFKGLLVGVERGSAESTFRFYDVGFRMRRVKKTQHHNRLTALELIAKLARRNHLLFGPPDEKIKLQRRNFMQDGLTDWELASECAEEAGLVLFVRHDTLFAKEAATYGAPVASLYYRSHFQLLHNFSLQYKLPENQEGRPATVEVRGRGRGGKRLVGKSQEHEKGHTQIHFKHDLPRNSKNAADSRAQAKKDLQRESAFQLSVQVSPTWEARRPDARDTVELLNVGKLFSGLYICDAVTHTLNGGSFTTDLDLIRDAKLDSKAS